MFKGRDLASSKKDSLLTFIPKYFTTIKTHSRTKDHMIRPGDQPEGHQFNPASAAAMSGHGALFSGHGVNNAGKMLAPPHNHLIGRTHEAGGDDQARADRARAKRTRNVLSALAQAQQPRSSTPGAEADDDGFHHSASQGHGHNLGLGPAKSRPEEPASHYIKKGHGVSKASVQVGSMKLQRRSLMQIYIGK